jgi:tripartite-type tricarboxylate transporter receptor subunit TctC
MGLRYLALGAISAVLLSLAHGTWTGLSAEERFPAHPVHLIVPAPAGGSLDIGIRIIEPRLSAFLGAPIVIVNRSGASGAVAMAAVASAPADGYTLAATSTSTLTVISLTQNLPYGLGSFIPIGNYAVDAGMIVVRSDAPWKTLDELVEHARQFPGKLTYGSYGIGSLSTLNMEAIKVTSGIDVLNVPYPGAPQAILAVVGKQVDIGATPYSAAASFLQAGALRALMTSADARLPTWPDVPTLSEKGVRHAKLKLMLGLYAPAGTPAPVVAALERALQEAAADPQVSASLGKASMFIQYEDSQGLRRLLESEYADVMELGREMGLMKDVRDKK